MRSVRHRSYPVHFSTIMRNPRIPLRHLARHYRHEVGIMHNQMFPWLEAEAQKDGMSTLVRGLTDLPLDQNQQDNDLFKRNTLRALFIGWDRPFTLAGLKNAITTRSFKSLWLKRKVDWQKVSLAMIQMHKMVKNLGMDIWKYTEGWDKTVISRTVCLAAHQA